jgi:hypothetical protein
MSRHLNQAEACIGHHERDFGPRVRKQSQISDRTALRQWNLEYLVAFWDFNAIKRLKGSEKQIS